MSFLSRTSVFSGVSVPFVGLSALSHVVGLHLKMVPGDESNTFNPIAVQDMIDNLGVQGGGGVMKVANQFVNSSVRRKSAHTLHVENFAPQDTKQAEQPISAMDLTLKPRASLDSSKETTQCEDRETWNAMTSATCQARALQSKLGSEITNPGAALEKFVAGKPHTMNALFDALKEAERVFALEHLEQEREKYRKAYPKANSSEVEKEAQKNSQENSKTALLAGGFSAIFDKFEVDGKGKHRVFKEHMLGKLPCHGLTDDFQRDWDVMRAKEDMVDLCRLMAAYSETHRHSRALVDMCEREAVFEATDFKREGWNNHGLKKAWSGAVEETWSMCFFLAPPKKSVSEKTGLTRGKLCDTSGMSQIWDKDFTMTSWKRDGSCDHIPVKAEDLNEKCLFSSVTLPKVTRDWTSQEYAANAKSGNSCRLSAGQCNALVQQIEVLKTGLGDDNLAKVGGEVDRICPAADNDVNQPAKGEGIVDWWFSFAPAAGDTYTLGELTAFIASLPVSQDERNALHDDIFVKVLAGYASLKRSSLPGLTLQKYVGNLRLWKNAPKTLACPGFVGDATSIKSFLSEAGKASVFLVDSRSLRGESTEILGLRFHSPDKCGVPMVGLLRLPLPQGEEPVAFFMRDNTTDVSAQIEGSIDKFFSIRTTFGDCLSGAESAGANIVNCMVEANIAAGIEEKFTKKKFLEIPYADILFRNACATNSFKKLIRNWSRPNQLDF